MSDAGEPVYSRASDVVWRLGPDRVLVRRVGAIGHDAAADLLGDAALVWIALDEPGTTSAIIERIAPTLPDVDTCVVGSLVVGDWVTTTTGVGSEQVVEG